MFNNVKEFNKQSSMARLQERVNNIQTLMNTAIENATYKGKSFRNGEKAKTSLIRSQNLIYELHEYIKDEFIYYGIDPELIFPPKNESKPEINISGRFKQKKQDVCIVPKTIENKPEKINWGVLRNSGKSTIYGAYKEERILCVNLRSQMSSLAKNSDTLFERMIAEPLNLHLQYPNLVIGELYMIPVYEYDEVAARDNQVKFKKKITDLAKYISFFTELNGYNLVENGKFPFKYNRAGLLIVDFSRKIPKIYTSTEELKKDKLIPEDYSLELAKISPVNLSYNLLQEYKMLMPNNSHLGNDKS